MRTIRRKGNTVLIIIAFCTVWMFSCSVVYDTGVAEFYNSYVQTRDAPKATEISEVMEPNATLDAAWEHPATTVEQDPSTTPSWPAADCSGLEFIRYELIEKYKSETATTYGCTYSLSLTNIDDTIILHVYHFSINSNPIFRNEWRIEGNLPPGETRKIDGYYFYDPDAELAVDSSIITKIAIVVALPQCDWVWMDEVFDPIAVEVPPYCMP